MSLIAQIIQQLADARGVKITLHGQHAVGGGCINQAQRVETEQGEFFIKFNSAGLLDMFEAEAEGLTELAAAKSIRVPTPYLTGTADGQSYIVMENLHTGAAGSMRDFGRQLAEMHRYTRDSFGWHRDNTIGATPQVNQQNSDWVTFWQRQRLGFQLDLAKKNGAAYRLFEKGQQLIERLPLLFSDYQPLASVLHGDLWSGNFAMLTSGEAAIFDPAVYFGDRETDIAMSELFGGFSRDFYAGYNAAWPLDAGYRVRKTLYNLYHILNHYNLFSGGYAVQAERMVEQLLAEV